ncbi:Nucleoporin NSP1/NUP62 [Phytophthora cactorum]|nr:Nucleoporin NSP1/NUP62 [Phytophthora cactorum]
MSFNFGASSAAPSGGFNFGASSAPPQRLHLPIPAVSPSLRRQANGSSQYQQWLQFRGDVLDACSPAEAKTSATSAPSTGFNFGSTAPSSTAGSTGTSSFSFGAKAPAAEAKPAASSGFNFSATSTTAEAKTPAPASSGFSFGGASTTAEAKPAAPASGGFSFGAKPATDAKPAEAKPATGFSFSGSSAASSAATSTTTTSTGGFSFGGAKPTTSTAAESTTETTAPTLAFGTSTASSAARSTTTATSTAATTAITAPVTETDKPPAEYMGRTIEDIINAWSEQLERNADTFTTEAVKVSKWDSDLMDSQRKLGDIAGDVRRIQVAQNELDTNLDTIFAYQMELKSTLEQLEKSVDKMYESQDQMPVAADIEREQTLQLSVDIDDQLNSMTTTLKETVEKLNKAQDDVADDNNPMVQIMKVLNVHHNSLQWIEGSAGRINSDIVQLSRKLQDSSI